MNEMLNEPGDTKDEIHHTDISFRVPPLKFHLAQ